MVEMESFDEAMAWWHRKYLADVLKVANNSMSEAAKIAGKDRKYMYVLVGKYRVERPRQKPGRKDYGGNAAWKSLGN